MLARLSRMELSELGWRSRASARIAWDRLRTAGSEPTWDRRALAGALATEPAFDDVRASLGQGEWSNAHRQLASHFASRPQKFALAPSNRASIVETINGRFPSAQKDAKARADEIVAGRYDLLGYHGLMFQGASNDVDWQRDPVNGRRAPRRFWSEVPFLDPACGDHKIIWELNRHQHWLALGRAYWLTGETMYRDRALRELTSWLAANPPLTGINWASMLEMGLRSLSWLWMLAFFVESTTAEESPWIVDVLLALDCQLTQIERNLSYYFSPNTHLAGEGLALYVAGRSLPELRRSPQREAIGRRILIDEIRRQIAPDGGHCERSTHYHRYTLDFYMLALVIARVTNDPAAGEFEHAVARLAWATRLLADDRGRLPHLGDDDGGALFPMCGRAPDDVRDSLAIAGELLARPDMLVEPAPEEAYWLLAHPRIAPCLRIPRRAALFVRRSGALADTGYYVSRSARGDHLVVDGGAHGYLNGGHAHADALSLTLAVAGVPFLVDPGTGNYTVDVALRDRLRSSQMHNTLVIDGRSQSTVRGPFSWTSTANTQVRSWRTHDVFDYFEGEHDGYHPLSHRRHVLMLRGDMLVVADLVRGTGDHTAAVHWHIDPLWTVKTGGAGAAFATFPSGGAQCQLAVPEGHIEQFSADPGTGLGWHAPIYGSVEPLTSLRITRRGTFPFWIVSVFGLVADNPIVGAEVIAITAGTRAIGEATALRITRRSSTDVVMMGNREGAGDEAWRFGEFESDARVLFCRLDGEQLARVGLLDGSFVRKTAAPSSRLEMPHRVPQMHVNLHGLHQASSQRV
jgi:hypothetical protein